MKKLTLGLIAVMLISALFLSGCGGDDRVAAVGDTVSVHYTGTLDDGTEFDSSRDRGPMSFTVGSGQMIAGFDAAVRGMKVGETKTVTLPPEEAYGLRHEELVVALPRDRFPVDGDYSVGQKIQMQDSSGQIFNAVILEIGNGTITIDANHELAGKALTFEIEMVSITPAGN